MDKAGVSGGRTEVLCGPCEKTRMSIKATLFCLTCKEPFCSNCTKLHRAQSWAQNHSYMSLTEETKSTINSVLSAQVTAAIKLKAKVKTKVKQSRWKSSADEGRTYRKELQQQHDHYEMTLENELFCEQHQVIVCDLCKDKEHKNCKNFTPIDDVAKAKRKSREAIELVSSLKKYYKFAELMYKDRVEEVDILEKKREMILPQLSLVRQRFDEMLKDIEKTLMAEFESLHERNMKKLSQEKDRLANLKKMTSSDAETFREIYTDTSKTTSSAFIKAFTRIHNKRPVYERFLKEIYEEIINHDYIYTISQETVEKAECLQTIGELKQVDTLFRLPPFLVIDQPQLANGSIGAKVKAASKFAGLLTMQRAAKAGPLTAETFPLSATSSSSFESESLPGSGSNSSSSVLSSGSSGPKEPTQKCLLPPSPPRSPPSARAKSVNMFVPFTDEPQQFFITAIGCLPSGDLAIVDRSASELKVHDDKLKSSTSYSFESLPWDLTVLPDRQFAVTLPGENMVKVVKLVTVMKEKKENNKKVNKSEEEPVNELVHVKDVHCKGECWGVVYCGNSLFVTCNPWTNRPYVLRMSLDNNPGEWTAVPVKGVDFTAPQHIACNTTCTELYVTDSAEHRVIAFSTDGQLKFVYKSSELGCPTGISVDSIGNIFVCGKETSNVHLIEPGGSEGGEILSGSDGIMKPRGICYCAANANLYVANSNTPKIKAYTV